MPLTNGFMRELGPLSAYGEYSEETYSPQVHGTTSRPKSAYIPVNRLAGELSPYLLSRANDPVGWQSWGEEAFRLARSEDRPLFVSVGYSSEHWCHVMGRDCFSDAEVAGMLNDACIPVLVDREERPDLDNLLMEICRVQNGSAGWPLNIFLTPEGKPFFCTTWLPKRTTGQMPGITSILPRIRWLWHMQRGDVERFAATLDASVRERLNVLGGIRSGGHVGRHVMNVAIDDTRRIFDVRWGGFGGSPKFPEYNKLMFLQDTPFISERDKSDAGTMTDITLRRMWRGGIHDHLGGGFSRYSIDEQWIVPHFEKLLPEQAMMLMTASRLNAKQGGTFPRLLAEDIIHSVIHDFTDDASFSQGFRSAIDGDTPQGEGRYYLWNEDEIRAVLPEGDASLFCSAYAVLPSGNFGSEIAGSQMSLNILYEASTVTELARRYGLKGAEVASRLAQCRKLLLDARDMRCPLKYDGKVLMGWNGLMIAALAGASVSFNQREWLDMAERPALFIRKTFRDKSGTWRRRWVAGKSGVDAQAEDYVYFLWAVVELWKASKHFNVGEKQLSEWLELSRELADILMEKFGDAQNGGLYETSGAEFLPYRLKTCEDINSLPSVNAVAMILLDELSFILEDAKYSEFSRKIEGCFSRYVRENPMKCLTMITASMNWKPYKPVKKPEPEVKPIPTDEELNREEPSDVQGVPEEQEDSRKSSRATRRAQRSGTSGSAASSERRGTRGHRPTRSRER